MRERDRLAGEVIDMEKRLVTNRYYSENLEYIIRNNEDALNKMTARAKFAENERVTVETKSRALMKANEEQKEAHVKTMQKLDQTSKELAETSRKLIQKTTDFDRQKLQVEKYKSEVNVLNKTVHKNEDEIAELNKTQKANEELIKHLRLLEKEKSNTIILLTGKLKKSVEDQNAASTRLYKLNRKVLQLNNEILRLKYVKRKGFNICSANSIIFVLETILIHLKKTYLLQLDEQMIFAVLKKHYKKNVTVCVVMFLN